MKLTKKPDVVPDAPAWTGAAVTEDPEEVPTPPEAEDAGPCVAFPGDYIHLVSGTGERLRGLVLAVQEPANAFSRIACLVLTFAPQVQTATFANIPPAAARDGEAWAWEWVAR